MTSLEMDVSEDNIWIDGFRYGEQVRYLIDQFNNNLVPQYNRLCITIHSNGITELILLSYQSKIMWYGNFYLPDKIREMKNNIYALLTWHEEFYG